VEDPEPASGRGGILVYIDGSDTCITAAQYAIFLAKSLDRPLTAVYVVDTKVLGDLVKARIFVKEEAFDYEYDLQQDGRRYLSYVEQLARAKGLACTVEIITGEANVQVLNKADQVDAELIVLNELERRLSRRDSHFDEKERILRRAKCTVVIAKDEDRVASLYESL
jgi:nucleotide-binding universal stress UspA family protein